MNIENKIREDSYNERLTLLERRSKSDSFDIEEVKRELNSLYNYQGLDWTGRGELKNSEIDGEVSAYQVFIHQYAIDTSPKGDAI